MKIAVLLIASALCALIQGLILGNVELSGNTGPYSVAFEEVEQWDSVIWVDARMEKAYMEKHYPMALHLTEDNWDSGLSGILSIWDIDIPIVVYCDGDQCESSRLISQRLRQEIGVEEVYWLEGGWEMLREKLVQ